MSTTTSSDIQRENRTLGLKLALIVPVMLVFCASLVPLYRVICEQLGITQSRVIAGAGNTQVDLSRKLTVELLASRNQNMGWHFEPLQRSVRVHPGELTTVMYRVTNPYDKPMVGKAVYSVLPPEAGRKVEKLQCFCFSDQTLGPGETRDMPIVFRIRSDVDQAVDTVSFSYTFFDVTAERGGKGG
ncbi:MAG: cytochrome c oxidase assembly protein [Betaproteobacteria bacterium]|nr:cytochrome c oxidase assembly protein [Betaproteobacteria bacterium]